MLSKVTGIYRDAALIKLIIIGLLMGIFLAVFLPMVVPFIAIFGKLFVELLRSVAPILVFALVINAMSKRTQANSMIKPIIKLYIINIFLSAVVAVIFSFLFPITLKLQIGAGTTVAPPTGISDILINLIINIVDNPIHALMDANYISILAWSVLIGLAAREAGDELHKVLDDISRIVTKIVQWVISFAPFGIMGLVSDAIVTSGIGALLVYGKLVGLLLLTFFNVALIINPLIVFFNIRMNPYPLVLSTLRESGIYAFFTRSSAANIPVNLRLCKRLGLNPSVYSISIPLGAAINTAGGAITISIMTLAAVRTIGIPVDLPTAFLLCLIATIGACGTSGVAGGSLLLIPVACASFGISNDISMQIVGIGFIIAVIQDSFETALNSSSDALFTATVEFAERKKEGTLQAEDLVPHVQ